MRLRCRSLCCALVVLHLVVAPASSGAMSRAPEVVPPARPAAFAPQRASKVDTALADVTRILREENSCSQFFGGSGQALEVLGRLGPKLREERLADPLVGIRMSGLYENIRSLPKGYSYRMFDYAVVNTYGPFFSPGYNHDMRVRTVGSFHSGSRESRAVMLLHELGHLIRGADDKWLLADDAGNNRRGHLNTLLVERHCGKLIRNLRKTKPEAQPEQTSPVGGQVAQAPPAELVQ